MLEEQLRQSGGRLVGNPVTHAGQLRVAERAPLHLWGPFRYAELRGVSHWIPDEAPAALAELLLEHIVGP